MIIELHIATRTLLRQLRNTLATARCIDATLPVDGTPRYLDHLQIDGDGQLEASFAAGGPPDLVIVQPARAVFASFAELRAAGAHGTKEAAGVHADVTLRFRLSASASGSGAAITIAFAGLEAPTLDAATRTVLGAALEFGVGPQSSHVSLSSLSRLMGSIDVSRAELSVPRGHDSPLALRLSVNAEEPTLFDSPPFWLAFEQGTLFDAPARDWAVVMDGQVVVDLVSGVLDDSLKTKIADGAFTLESGPSGFWETDRARVSLHGSINDACEVLWWQIDMGTEITASLRPSCPSPNVVRFDFALDLDDNKLAVFVCSVASTFQFWFSAVKFLQEGSMKPGQYALGLLAEFFGAPQLIFGFAWDKLSRPPISDQIPAESQGVPLQKVEPTSHDVEVQGDMAIDLGAVDSLGDLVIEHVGGSAVGPVFSGALPPAPVREQVDLHVERMPWAWKLVDSCSPAAGYQLVASISYGAQDAGAQPIGLCAAHVLRTAPDNGANLDPAGQFAAAAVDTGDGAQEVVLTLGEAQVRAAYLDTPYDCFFWLDTDAGKRVVDLGAFPALTAELKAELDKAALRPDCTGVGSAKLWAGDWNPRWSVDPGPQDWGELVQLWQFAVTAVAAGDRIELRAGDAEVGVASELAGRAHLSHLAMPGAPELALARIGRGGELPHGERVVTMQQVQLARLGVVRAGLDGLQGFAALGGGGRGWLALASGGRVELYDVTRPGRAVPAGALPVEGVRGVRAAGDRLYTFGELGVAAWRPVAGGWQADGAIRGAATGLDVARGHLAVVQGGCARLYDTALRPCGELDAEGVLDVLLDARDAHVITADAIVRHDTRSLAAGQRLALPAPARIDRIVDDGRPGVFAVTHRDGQTVVFAPDARRELHRVETYRETPWFVGAQRLGELLFTQARRGRGVWIDRIVARKTVRR